MKLTIPIAHDFVCPWCYIAVLQVETLVQEFDVEFEWRAYELMPEPMEFGTHEPAVVPPNRPPTLSRLEFLEIADGITVPKTERPYPIRTRNPHIACEYAAEEGVKNPLVHRIYRAYFEQGRDISDIGVLRDIATGLVNDLDAMERAIRERRYGDRIVEYDDDAYASGVYNVPTFFIGGERLAEMPLERLRAALRTASGDDFDLYRALQFPESPAGRPYVALCMVSTIDGKILSGGRDEDVSDLGSANDRRAMERVESAVDTVLVGAQSVRATSRKWNPKTARRVVVTRTGDLPFDAAFFGGESYVATTESAAFEVPAGVKVLRSGSDRVDLAGLLNRLAELGTRRVVAMGGSELNAQLFRQGLVDEIFLTIAPKVKLGADVPTIAGGEALARNELLGYRLVSEVRIGDETFLRYRR